MHYMIIAIMMAVIAVIGMMLQRVFQGPTVYDRMNGLGVTGLYVPGQRETAGTLQKTSGIRAPETAEKYRRRLPEGRCRP